MAEHEVGSIVAGKVIKVAPFGAIVALEGGGQGLVHISQVANTFVQDINEYVKVNDEVKVKVLSIDPETHRISLSIRAALPKPEHTEGPKNHRPRDNRGSRNDGSANDFEEKMKEFLKQSNDKMATLNKRANKR